jgi:hypothetical protein
MSGASSAWKLRSGGSSSESEELESSFDSDSESEESEDPDEELEELEEEEPHELSTRARLRCPAASSLLWRDAVERGLSLPAQLYVVHVHAMDIRNRNRS